MTSRADTRDAAPAILDAAVVTWGRKQLLAAGFGLPASEILARDCGIDLHALLDLVQRGCQPPLAMRILAPLEGDRDAADRSLPTDGRETSNRPGLAGYPTEQRS